MITVRFNYPPQAVKEALLSVLSEELLEMFDNKCREAWSQTVDVVIGVMISGMK